jgi:hypothetical protein
MELPNIAHGSYCFSYPDRRNLHSYTIWEVPHFHNIMEKLKARSIADLTKTAIQKNLIKL